MGYPCLWYWIELIPESDSKFYILLESGSKCVLTGTYLENDSDSFPLLDLIEEAIQYELMQKH